MVRSRMTRRRHCMPFSQSISLPRGSCSIIMGLDRISARTDQAAGNHAASLITGPFFNSIGPKQTFTPAPRWFGYIFLAPDEAGYRKMTQSAKIALHLIGAVLSVGGAIILLFGLAVLMAGLAWSNGSLGDTLL